MNKKTLYGSEARAKILEGVKKIVAAISPTLGPSGRNICISQSIVVDYGVHSLPVHITKDGVTVARAFDLDEPMEKPGVLLVKEACQKTVDQAGDGTTTCAVLLEAIAIEGIKLVEQGANPMQLKKEIDNAVEYVVSELQKMAIPVKGNIERIRQIATVSANNDSSIGDKIAEAYEKIGEEGVIDIVQSTGTKTEVKTTDGFKFDNGWISPYFINNKQKQVTEFGEPYILLYDKRITHHSQFENILTQIVPSGRPVLIICEDADEEGLAVLAMNNINQKGGLVGRVCIVKAPFGENRFQNMEDIATLTGGTFFSDRKGLDIKKAKLNELGIAQKAIITKDETIIIGGKSNKKELENLLNELRMNLTQAKNEDEKSPIEKRIARLTGGIAVIHVGAATETEMKERLDRFDDSVRATKAAIEEGFLPGAGTAFLSIENTGSKIIDAILDAPIKQICANAGVESDEKIKFIRGKKSTIGYNAKTDKIEDLIESGIIDPAKVLRCALQNAASAAGMILTCEAEICDTL